MQKRSFFSLFLAFSSLFPFQKMTAQDCSSLFPSTKNAEWETTHFDKKGLPELIATSRLVERKESENGFRVTVETAMTDEKGKDKSAFNYDFECVGDRLTMDLRSFLAPESLGAYEGMEMSFSGTALEFPAKMEIGQTLPDADMEAQVKSGSMILIRLKFKITNRKVVAREEVTTTAGRFDCWKTTHDVESKAGFLTAVGSSVQWLAAGAGIVKAENFDKKGRLTSSQQLTRLKK